MTTITPAGVMGALVHLLAMGVPRIEAVETIATAAGVTTAEVNDLLAQAQIVITDKEDR